MRRDSFKTVKNFNRQGEIRSPARRPFFFFFVKGNERRKGSRDIFCGLSFYGRCIFFFVKPFFALMILFHSSYKKYVKNGIYSYNLYVSLIW